MKIRLVSDLHLEMGPYDVKSMPGDKDTVLVLAGDVGLIETPSSYKTFLEDLGLRFRRIIYVPGNHEFYRGSYPYSIDKLIKNLEDIPNVIVGERFKHQIDDVMFICATMWTDVNGNDPIAAMNIRQMMNDFRIIRTGNKIQPWQRKFTPDDCLAAFRTSTNCHIFPEIKRAKEQGLKTVIVTHHLPSEQSIPSHYKNDPCNPGYASRLDDKIIQYRPDFWFHGHTHESCDYMIGDTRILCNPAGYPSERNPMHDHRLMIEI